MPTQIELLKEAIERLEPIHGPENPFVKGLKVQLIGLERQKERVMERETFNLTVKPPLHNQPEPEDIAAFKLYEELISKLPKE